MFDDLAKFHQNRISNYYLEKSVSPKKIRFDLKVYGENSTHFDYENFERIHYETSTSTNEQYIYGICKCWSKFIEFHSVV